MEENDEERDKIAALLCSVDQSNRELGLTLMQSLKINIDIADWDCFLATSGFTPVNNINFFRAFFAKICRYTNCAINGEQYKNIPRGVFSLPLLTSLSISNSPITEINGDIARLGNLDNLTLQNLPYLQHISPEIFRLNNLKWMRIDNCPQLKLPDEWGAFPSINQLYITRCNLTSLPVGLLQAPHLSNLDLSHNNFNRLPEVISHLQKLETLEINHCNFNSFDNFNLPSNLETIHLMNCHLRNFSFFNFKNLTKLRVINLSHNEIKKLPESLLQCSDSLISLSLDDNRFDKIPDYIGDFSKLSYLSLAENKLKQLPDSLGKLKELFSLRLYNNPFNPKEIHRIKKLLPKNAVQSEY